MVAHRLSTLASMSTLTFVVLGGSGDLARRLLLPGLAEYMAEDPALEVTLVGAGLSEENDYSGSIRQALLEAGAPAEATEALAERTSWMTVDATSSEDGITLTIDTKNMLKIGSIQALSELNDEYLKLYEIWKDYENDKVLMLSPLQIENLNF